MDAPEQRASGERKLVGMLARKGYGAGIAYRVVREALAEHGAEPDELGPSDCPTSRAPVCPSRRAPRDHRRAETEHPFGGTIRSACSR